MHITIPLWFWFLYPWNKIQEYYYNWLGYCCKIFSLWLSKFIIRYYVARASQVVLVVEYPSVNAGDIRDSGLVPRMGRSLGGGHGNPLQYSCLENPMDRGAWWATVHGITKSRTWLNDFTLERLRNLNVGWRNGGKMRDTNRKDNFHYIFLFKILFICNWRIIAL